MFLCEIYIARNIRLALRVSMQSKIDLHLTAAPLVHSDFPEALLQVHALYPSFQQMMLHKDAAVGDEDTRYIPHSNR